jgi:hypothetical protein
MRAFGVMLLGAAALLVPCLAAAQDAKVFAVVVPASSGIERLEANEVAQIFRRRKSLWPDGRRIVPVNLPVDHALRLRFSRAVLRQSPEQQAEYWNQQYFQGVLPPHVLPSENAVERFLVETPNAIGYLPYCGLNAQLRAVLRIDTDGRVLDDGERVVCTAGAP